MAKITVEFDRDDSASCKLSVEGCSFMQLFAAAKLIEIQGEGVYMEGRMQQAMRADKGKLVIPKVMPQ